MLDIKLFQDVVRNTPLISIDLIIKNKKNEILLGLRKNAPAKKFWFVPGGRIYKNENLDEAIKRIFRAELNITNYPDNLEYLFHGVYEHIYTDNFLGNMDFSTHYIALALIISYDFDIKYSETTQHNEYRYFNEDKLLTSDLVHYFTKQYFVESPENKL